MKLFKIIFYFCIFLELTYLAETAKKKNFEKKHSKNVANIGEIGKIHEFNITDKVDINNKMDKINKTDQIHKTEKNFKISKTVNIKITEEINQINKTHKTKKNNITNETNIIENMDKNNKTDQIEVDKSRYNEHFEYVKACGGIENLPHSCETAMKSNSSRNGVYLLNLSCGKLKPYFVYCNRIDGEVWTIIQRRQDGSVDFYRYWYNYKNGFGNLYGEFWLGLKRMHIMTKTHKYALRVWLQKEDGTKAYAHYNKFVIANEAEKYKLIASNHSGDAADLLGVECNATNYPNNAYGLKFSTYDNINDFHRFVPCPVEFKSGWWFYNCFYGHLNGLYKNNDKYDTEKYIDFIKARGVFWSDFGELIYAQMGMRRV